MKIICTSPSFAKHSSEPLVKLKEEGYELVRVMADISEDDFIEQAKGAQAAIVAFNQINENVLSQLPELKVIAKHGVGVDNIDLEAAKRHGVTVTNVPNANKHAVADYSFSLMLSLARKITEGNKQTKNGIWESLFGADVYNKTIGVIGLGAIGKEVAKRAKGFSMDIIAYDPYIDEMYSTKNNIQSVSLNELLQNSDFITLHMPLLEETKHLISTPQFNLMKESAYLINASRGGIIDETALYKALESNKIAGAALDVFETEPLIESPLFHLNNFIAMPHVAGYTPGAINILSNTCVDQIVAILKGKENIEHVVSSS